MDVEKTIQFMLEHEARLDARMEELTATVEENSAQIKKNSTQIGELRAELRELGAQTHRRLKTLTTLMEAGLKRLTKQEKAFEFRINALIDAQERTDKKLDRLIALLSRRGPNGAGRLTKP